MIEPKKKRFTSIKMNGKTEPSSCNFESIDHHKETHMQMVSYSKHNILNLNTNTQLMVSYSKILD